MTTRLADLRISEDFSLPIDAITEAIAILGTRGGGKTSTAVVYAEELVKAGQQIIVLDPIGTWWGLRASASGPGPGLPVLVMGGEHGDLPLTEFDAVTVADFLVVERAPAVLDLSHMTKGEQVRFVNHFAETIWQRKAREEFRTPVSLILEEAEEWGPQKPQKNETVMLSRIERLAKLGRNRGIGMLAITQRSASLNKDVLTQCSTLILLRTVAPQDRRVVMDWIGAHDVQDEADAVMAELPRLPVGTGWVWSPGWLQTLRRVPIRRRETFDSSATPKVGETRAEPKALAEIDLEAFAGRLGAMIEQAKEDDPEELRRRIRDQAAQIANLEKALTEKIAEGEPRTVVEVVQVPVFDPAIVPEIDRLSEIAENIGSMVESLRGDVTRGIFGGELRLPDPPDVPTLGGVPGIVPVPTRIGNGKTSATENHSAPSREAIAGFPKLGGGELAILEALARMPGGRATLPQLGQLSGYSHTGGTFQKYLGVLRREGLIERGGNRATLTPLGASMTRHVVRATTADELFELWRRALGAERALMTALVSAYPKAISIAELAAMTGYEASGGTFQKYLGILNRNGLIEPRKRGGPLRAARWLMGDSEKGEERL